MYFDCVVGKCFKRLRYTLLADNTVVLTENQSDLYPPAPIKIIAKDVSATPFPYSIVVKADNFGDLSKIVTFTAMAEDDCSSVSTISLNQDSGIKAVNMIFQLKLGAPCHCHY